MRYFLILAALTLPITADAQGRGRTQHRASSSPPRAAATAPRTDFAGALLPAGSQQFRVPLHKSRLLFPAESIRVGNPRSFSRFGAPRPGDQRDRAGERWPQRRGDRKWRPNHDLAPPFFGGGYYGAPFVGYDVIDDTPGAAQNEMEAEAAAMRTTGVLRLDITPATDLQYYIDGMFMGSSSQLGTEFAVNAGARRIEIRAPGYKPMIFDARFEPDGTVTRRGALEPLQEASTPPRATGSRTMYVIPGCFIGNSRPEPDALPKGCDIKRLVMRGAL